MTELKIGEWLPDQAEHENPGALLVKNCLPLLDSYKSINALEPFTDPLPGTAAGAFWIKSKGGVIFNFAATSTDLYLFDGVSGWTNVSGPSGPYSAQVWDFVNFQERVIATDGGGSALQYFDVGVPSTDFADLPGADAIALRCKTLGIMTGTGQVLAGAYSDATEDEPGGFAYSGFNNSEKWAPSLATQAGRRRGRGNGGISQRLVSGSEVVHFRENSIERVQYVGPPVVMGVTDITTLHGTPAPRSVCWTGKLVFYYSPEGFMQLDRSSYALKAIGDSKVNDWFIANVDPLEVVNMQGTVDRIGKYVFWSFRSSASSPVYDRMLVYDYAHERFSYIEQSAWFLTEFTSPGYNLDTIGAVLGGDIDSASISVDDPTYKGGAFQLAAFNSSNEMSTFTGAPLEAIIDTTEMRHDPDHRGYVNGVRPFIEGSPSTLIRIAPITRNQINENPVVGDLQDITALTGIADMRVNARFHRYRLEINGGFKHARKVTFQPKRRGRK